MNDNNNKEVLLAWRKYNAQLLHDDIHGSYVAFTLTTELDRDEVETRLENAAADVARREYRLTDASSMHKRKRFGICLQLIPATSRAGTKHFHGWIRVPVMDQRWRDMTVCEKSKTVVVSVPYAVREVFDPRRHRLWNVNICHDRGTRRAIILNEDVKTADDRALNYWSKTSDGEVRDFANASFIPHRVRFALPNAVAR